MLKDHFGDLKEVVAPSGQDIQKFREGTMAVESRVSDLEYKLPPVIRESQLATPPFLHTSDLD